LASFHGAARRPWCSRPNQPGARPRRRRNPRASFSNGAVAQDAGVVHEDVYAPPLVDGGLHHALGAFGVCDRIRIGNRGAACSLDLGSRNSSQAFPEQCSFGLFVGGQPKFPSRQIRSNSSQSPMPGFPVPRTYRRKGSKESRRVRVPSKSKRAILISGNLHSLKARLAGLLDAMTARPMATANHRVVSRITTVAATARAGSDPARANSESMAASVPPRPPGRKPGSGRPTSKTRR